MTLPSLLEVIQLQLETSPFWTAFWGAVLGTLVTIFLGFFLLRNSAKFSPAMIYHRDRRRRLPDTIIVIRHGESEANADKTLWKTIPDNLLGLTKKGRQEARDVGKRAAKLLEAQNAKRVHLVVSPFERTIQTSHYLRRYFEHRIVRTDIESRIREQEVGNIQGDEFTQYRKEQLAIGRFFYRFPTGESGADVLDRVKSWWYENVLAVNTRPHFEHIDAMVVVTHGLTMRFILMQLFGWSPTTFHSVWNAGNCDMYVLRKDLSKPGHSPYILDPTSGDMPRSSIDVRITLKKTKQERTFRLENYLSIPPPRMTRKKLIKHLLAEQYPNEIESHKDIGEIVFMPFIQGGVIRGRSSSGVYTWEPSFSSDSTNGTTSRSNSRSSSDLDDENSNCEGNNNDSENETTDDRVSDDYARFRGLTSRLIIENAGEESSDEEEEKEDASIRRARATQEASLRYPCCEMMPGMKSWY